MELMDVPDVLHELVPYDKEYVSASEPTGAVQEADTYPHEVIVITGAVVTAVGIQVATVMLARDKEMEKGDEKTKDK